MKFELTPIKDVVKTVQNSLRFHFICGPTGYHVLRSQGYPFPAARTIRLAIEGICFSGGLINKVFSSWSYKFNICKQRKGLCTDCRWDEYNAISRIWHENRPLNGRCDMFCQYAVKFWECISIITRINIYLSMNLLNFLHGKCVKYGWKQGFSHLSQETLFVC